MTSNGLTMDNRGQKQLGPKLSAAVFVNAERTLCGNVSPIGVSWRSGPGSLLTAVLKSRLPSPWVSASCLNSSPPAAASLG